MSKVIVEDGSERQHRHCLESLLESTKGPVRIATAYLTDSELLSGIKNRRVQVLTSVLAMDIVSGATSLNCLKLLMESGVQCCRWSDGPRLHAKVYIFGDESVVVTSANLTGSALDSNIEVGVKLDGKAVSELIDWFDSVWAKAHPIKASHLAKWMQETASLRREFKALREKTRYRKKVPQPTALTKDSRARFREVASQAACFFVCNTDRRWSKEAEDLMRRRKYAAVWGDFKYPTHMQRVQPGDLIFMFAKSKGIIGVGRAKSKCEILDSRKDWLRNDAKHWTKHEWRIPIEDEWLVWLDDDAAAYPFSIPHASFVDVSGDAYAEEREAVIQHFLSRA